MIQLRPFQKCDLYDVLNLFYRTVHAVNRTHYNEEQLCAWAPYYANELDWMCSLASHRAFVAVQDEKIVGFGDCNNSGYLDRLYCAYDWQGKGVGTLLAQRLELETSLLGIGSIRTEASITAKPFFEARGYHVTEEQQKPLRGQVFINYKMEKDLPQGCQLIEKTFGQSKKGISYEHRPGAYGILQNSSGELGVVKTKRGLFLIGGGFEAAETPEECLKREFLEETGYDVVIGNRLCVVASYTRAFGDGRPFHPIAHCYLCSLGAYKQPPMERDHSLIWLSPKEAEHLLLSEHQRYAVSRALSEGKIVY